RRRRGRRFSRSWLKYAQTCTHAERYATEQQPLPPVCVCVCVCACVRVQLEEEIGTLKQVLSSKEKQQAELRQKLGITPLSELKNNFSRSWHDVQTSVAFKKTSETFSTAGQKTSAAFSTFGSAITRKLGDMSMAGLELLFPRRSNSIGYSVRHSVSMPTMRNSPSFKTFEEKVESTVSTIKTKVGGSGPGGNFEEVLSSAANASSQETPSNNLTDVSQVLES
uniref:Tpd52 like 1 n=1 Tax=Oryzias latipes TaxID=8090 RepID=A0A3P9K0D4_ORYLA